MALLPIYNWENLIFPPLADIITIETLGNFEEGIFVQECLKILDTLLEKNVPGRSADHSRSHRRGMKSRPSSEGHRPDARSGIGTA